MRLARLFELRWGSVLRFLMPFALLAAVYLPLRRALDEVAWEVRVRIEVLAVLDAGAFAGLESTLVKPILSEASQSRPLQRTTSS